MALAVPSEKFCGAARAPCLPGRKFPSPPRETRTRQHEVAKIAGATDSRQQESSGRPEGLAAPGKKTAKPARGTPPHPARSSPSPSREALVPPRPGVRLEPGAHEPVEVAVQHAVGVADLEVRPVVLD